MEQPKIPPKTEWRTLSISQLYDVKMQMMNRFYDMRSINASFSGQYKIFISELDGLIQMREAEALEPKDED
jgi:hypothetical protein